LNAGYRQSILYIVLLAVKVLTGTNPRSNQVDDRFAAYKLA
jgi:hypothetical protein